MLKTAIGVIIVSAGMVLAAPVWCEEDLREDIRGEDVLTFRGRVVATDWVASKLVVGYLDPETQHRDEITFRITPTTRITKGTDTIMFSDVNQFDNVVVEYTYTSFAGPKVVHLTVL